MSTWSDNRSSKAIDCDEQTKKSLELIKRFNQMLKKFSQDEYLQVDLKMPTVQAAILHWTNVARLSPDIAKSFERNQHVVNVLEKVRLITHESQKNPYYNNALLDAMCKGQNELRKEQIVQLFGNDVEAALNGKPIAPSVIKSKLNNKETKSTIKKEVAASTSPAITIVDVPVKEGVTVPKPDDNAASSSTYPTGTLTLPAEEATIDNDCPNPYPTTTSINAVSSTTTKAAVDATPIQLTTLDRIFEVIYQLSMWGHEDMNGPNFTWIKFILRIMIDTAIYGGISYWLALQFTPMLTQMMGTAGGSNGIQPPPVEYYDASVAAGMINGVEKDM